MDMFKEELKHRRIEYNEVKEIRDDLFHVIEHDKTQLRIIENKSDKSPSTKSIFPLKVVVGVINAQIQSNFLSNNYLGTHNIQESEQSYNASYFVVESKNTTHKSTFANSTVLPEWEDTFTLSILDELGSVSFRVYRASTNSDDSEEIDDFSIPAHSLITNFVKGKHTTETIITPSGNKYTILIKIKGDGQGKIKALKNKIRDNIEELDSKTQPKFDNIKDNLFNLLEFKDYELVLEWGIFDEYINDSEFDKNLKKILEKPIHSSSKKNKIKAAKKKLTGK